MRAPLQFAWMMNIALLLTIIALLLWDILSYYGEIPFGSVLVSIRLSNVCRLACCWYLDRWFVHYLRDLRIRHTPGVCRVNNADER